MSEARRLSIATRGFRGITNQLAIATRGFRGEEISFIVPIVSGGDVRERLKQGNIVDTIHLGAQSNFLQPISASSPVLSGLSAGQIRASTRLRSVELTSKIVESNVATTKVPQPRPDYATIVVRSTDPSVFPTCK